MHCPNCGVQLSLPASDANKPITMWGYFGYQILFSVPVIGFICLIIFAVGASNVNVRNFARSYFCVFIVGIILSVLFIVLLGGVGAMADAFSRVAYS